MKRLFRLNTGASGAADEAHREIETHIDMRAQEFIAAGLNPDDARKAALEAFGDRAAVEAEVSKLRNATLRERRRRDWFDELRADLTVGARGLVRAPGFTVIALLTLALGIGANTAIFSVLRSVLLRPLPYPNSEQLVQIWSDHRAIGRAEPEWLTPPDFADMRDGNRTFSGMTAYFRWQPDLTGMEDAEALSGILVSGNYFELFGVRAAKGRLLTMSDDDPAAERVVVLSDAVWRRRFGADSSILNRPLTLNGAQWIVVGIVPRAFESPVPFNPDVYAAIRRAPDNPCQRGCITVRAIGRLKPGVSIESAHQDLSGIAARIAKDFPATNEKVSAWLVPLHEQITGDTKAPVLALSAAVGLVLLIGCVNLAGLLLVRGYARAREFSVRVALGAGRGRIVRQLLAENALLAAIGGAIGIGLGVAGARLAAPLVPESVQRVQTIQVDLVVLGFAVLVTVAAGFLFGLLPALQAVRANVMTTLRGGARETGRRANALRSSLVVMQLSMAVVLLVGAGLLLRSFLYMQGADAGYRTSGVLLTSVTFPAQRYPVEQLPAALERALDRLRTDPTIKRAEITNRPPMAAGDGDINLFPVGDMDRADLPPSIWTRTVTPGYFAAMQSRIVAGRGFTAEDRRTTTRVAVLNELAARRYFPGRSAVGQAVVNGRDSTARRWEIIGVVANARSDGPQEPYKEELFTTLAQSPTRRATFVIEPARDAAAATVAVRRIIGEMDPMMPIVGLQSIDELTASAVALPKLYATLVGIFAIAALLLASLGVYGVMAYSVSQRHREIGVRLALGAAPSSIRAMVLRQGIKLAVVGVGVGIAGALALGRLLDAMLFGVTAVDAPTLLTVPLVLAGMTLLASWIPARHAVRVDPLTAIRQE